MTPNQQRFMTWLRAEHPAAYEAAHRELAQGQVSGLGFWQAFAAIASTALQAGQVALQQKANSAALKAQSKQAAAELQAAINQKQQLLALNVARAKANLPPVNDQGIVVGGASSQSSSMSGYVPYLLLGGGVLVLAVVVMKR